jgi:hypothetical protein
MMYNSFTSFNNTHNDQIWTPLATMVTLTEGKEVVDGEEGTSENTAWMWEAVKSDNKGEGSKGKGDIQ